MLATTKQSSSTMLLATFIVQGSLFALDAAAVQEVIRLGPVTPVRHAPAEVAGVINLRGRIVTLLDIGLLLGLRGAERNRETRIVLVEDQGEFIGLLVDCVGDVIEVEQGLYEPLPLNIPPAQARFLTNVCRAGNRVITLVDTKKLLASGR